MSVSHTGQTAPCAGGSQPDELPAMGMEVAGASEASLSLACPRSQGAHSPCREEYDNPIGTARTVARRLPTLVCRWSATMGSGG